MSNPYDKGMSTTSSVLGPTLKFKGELTANEDLLIQGQIEGSINHTSKLTIGQEGKLKANVKAEYITVEGKVNGDLAGSSSVVVKQSANVTGNIFSPVVTLREGSTFNGKIDMTGKEQPKAAAPEKLEPANDAVAEEATKSTSAERPKSASKKAGADKKSSANAA